MTWIWLGPVIVLLLFFLVIFVRTVIFVPKAKRQASARHEPIAVDGERAFKNLQAMLRIKTITPDGEYETPSSPNEISAEEFRLLLPKLYPLLHQHCTLERVGSGGLLYHWKGRSADSPSVYMAHYDVVPAEDDKWKKPPFSGERENGEIWGRGALDCKATLCAALETAETLLGKGFTPAQDIYFAFGGDEELRGNDVSAIVDLFESRGIRPALVLDEGGLVLENAFPGVKEPVALIGTGEKGRLNVEFSVSGAGGHASCPPVSTPVGVLARAVTKIEASPFPAYMCKPVKQMFDTLARHSTFIYRLIFANLWCFKGLFFYSCKKKGGEVNALVRTTCAFTQMSGSSAPNVLPPSASVVANMRVLSPDTEESVLADLRKLINNESISVKSISGINPSSFSNIDTEGYARVCSAIEAIWPEAIIAPYLMVGATDSRHFHRISDSVFRFCAMHFSSDDRKRIHGHDERIREEQLLDALAFYMRIMSSG